MNERLDAIAQAIDDSAMLRTDARGYPRLLTTPAIERVSMGPKSWREVKEHAPDRGVRKRWYYAANRRRIILLMLALAQTWLSTSLMSEVLPYHGRRPLEIAILVLFALLFTWVSLGFWTAMAGLVVLIGRRERFALSRSAAGNA
ncbi:MAG: glucan biosynthesis glucosyltransferase H, partial [Casimicrobiaceae bacterium]